MTREQFAKCIEQIEKMRSEYTIFADALSALADEDVVPGYSSQWVDAYLELLEVAVGDTEGYIGWYIWDSPSEDKVVMVGEQEWEVNDAYGLYDLIMEVKDASSSR